MDFVGDAGLANLFETESVNTEYVIKQCKSKLIEMDRIKWHSDMFNDTGLVNGNKLRTYRIYKTTLEPEVYVKNFLIRDHRRVLAMFRCGNLPLYIETGRYARPKIPLNERTGFHCKDVVENEIHFLLESPFYDDLRRKLFKNANLCNSDFDALNFTYKFIFLMNNINIQPLVANTLFDM